LDFAPVPNLSGSRAVTARIAGYRLGTFPRMSIVQN
jgi:hypothetical protein